MEMTDAPITINLSKFGLEPMSVEELTLLAVRAKTRIKANPAIGWSLPSKIETVAMAFVLDHYFTDCELPAPAKGKAPPKVYSNS